MVLAHWRFGHWGSSSVVSILFPCDGAGGVAEPLEGEYAVGTDFVSLIREMRRGLDRVGSVHLFAKSRDVTAYLNQSLTAIVMLV